MRCQTCGGRGNPGPEAPEMFCPDCDGTGFQDRGINMATCTTCKGRGQVPDPNDSPKCPSMVTCPTCGGDGEVCSTASGDWGYLPGEPCRFCRRTGGVYFLIDAGPEGRKGLSPCRCANCGRDWVPGESAA